jgi:hypothetical protein
VGLFWLTLLVRAFLHALQRHDLILMQPGSKFTDYKALDWKVGNSYAFTVRGQRVSPYIEPFASCLGMSGVLLGLGVSVPLREHFPLAMSPFAPLPIATRLLVGNAIVMGCYFAVRVVEKKACAHGSVPQRIVRMVRYGLVPLNILVCAPVVFNRLQI